MAAAHGLEVARHAVGFKVLGAELAVGRADLASDESGGFAFRPFGFDKDGIAAAALLARALAGRGESLRERVAGLERVHGRLRSGRSEADADATALAGLERLARTPPSRIGGARVSGTSTRDGVRLSFDDGFVMWRRSGTEPRVRIYAEALGERALEARLAAALRLLRRAGRVGPAKGIR